MKRGLGPEKVEYALDQAVKDFADIAGVKFKVKHLGLEFEGLLRKGLICEKFDKTEMERSHEAAEFLKTKEASLLKDSYVAYLAVHDLWKLWNKTTGEIEELLPTLDSERELAYFEGREIDSNSLFRRHRLREFFPKCASIDSFLTGMFVENLLWHEKPLKRTQERKPEYDFEVEF
jgi:hypothetical protein